MATKKTGPERTGSLYWTKSGWRVRLRVEIDGEIVQKSFDLETTDRAVAKIKQRRLVKQLAAGEQPTQEEAKQLETFEEAAKRIVGEESTNRTKAHRLSSLRRHAFPAIGQKRVNEIVAGDVRAILKTLADAGASKETCQHVRNDISSVLGELWRHDIIAENVCAKVQIPKHAKVDKRERAVLTDAELAVYLAWQHPDEKRRGAVLERQTMACVSRMFGGLRLGDLKAIRWQSFNIDDGNFLTGRVPREKTARAQLLKVPAMLRPILRDWWERAGRPTTGPMFPVRRGKRAGEQKKGGSPAKALRRDLARAFGIEQPVALPYVRANGRPDTKYTWEPAREMTPRELELFELTEYTKPVEFHSFRRAFKQGLADAGVDLQRSMQLSGATDPNAHRRYLNNTDKAREIPEEALPQLSISHAQFEKTETGNSIKKADRAHNSAVECVLHTQESDAAPHGLTRFLEGVERRALRGGVSPQGPCTVAMHSSRFVISSANRTRDSALSRPSVRWRNPPRPVFRLPAGARVSFVTQRVQP